MLYVAYASNLHPLRLRARTPSARLVGKATVPGWDLRFHKRSEDGSGKCNIVAHDGEIHVAIYDLTTEEKLVLDRLEGVGTGYHVETLEVTGFGECFVYVADEIYIDESLKPFTWYKELVAVGCEYLSFPRGYLERIATTVAVDDADRQRHDLHMRIVSKARRSGSGKRD